jgi:hypothetical protein
MKTLTRLVALVLIVSLCTHAWGFTYLGSANELPNGTVRPKTYSGYHYVNRYWGLIYIGHAAGADRSITVDAGSSTAWTLPYVSYEAVEVQATSGTATGSYDLWTETKEIIQMVADFVLKLVEELIF